MIKGNTVICNECGVSEEFENIENLSKSYWLFMSNAYVEPVCICRTCHMKRLYDYVTKTLCNGVDKED